MSEEKELKEEIERLMKELSPEVRAEAESILYGKSGLMPITSNRIEIVWVHPCGYGRKAVLCVTNEGKKEFERVMELCKKKYIILGEEK